MSRVVGGHYVGSVFMTVVSVGRSFIAPLWKIHFGSEFLNSSRLIRTSPSSCSVSLGTLCLAIPGSVLVLLFRNLFKLCLLSSFCSRFQFLLLTI